MKERGITGMFLILTLLVFTSCCGGETIEVTITGVESRAFRLEDDNLVQFDLQNPIDKEDLILEIDLLETEVAVASNIRQKKNSNADVYKAAVIPCEDPTFVYKNRIQSIKVELLDINNNNARIDVTNQVIIRGFQQSLSEFINENTPSIRDFLIEFSDTSNVPDRIEYDIQVTLDDDQVVSAAGGIINFN